MEEIGNTAVDFVYSKTRELINEMRKVVIGQSEFIEKLVVNLLVGGHVLIEGVPGLAKTLAAKTLARAVDAEFKRVQFTPDLMPADVIGTKVFDMKAGMFYLKHGPIFTNILLADEINRTPPKTQAAMLEAMEEKAVTIDGETYKLKDTFMVLATQNPVEYEGTYPLPEAQLDRFMMKLVVGYIPQNLENSLLDNYNKGTQKLGHEIQKISKLMTESDVIRCREEIQHVEVKNTVINYITSIVSATRNSRNLVLGASPRASIALLYASKAYAAIQGRTFVIPEDIKELAMPILRHRVVLNPEAGIEGMKTDDIIRGILNRVEGPR